MTTRSRQFEFVRDVVVIKVHGESLPMRLVFGPEYAGWLYVCHFEQGDPFQEANLIAVREGLRQTCGPNSFHVGIMTDDDNKVLFSFLIIRDLPDAMAVTAGLMASHENGEHICDESYWRVVDVHLQRMWSSLSIPDRIDYVKRTNTPPEAVLEPYVSEELRRDLWTMLYQDMGV